jgi:outer membrane receptor protein involved in Fe transport
MDQGFGKMWLEKAALLATLCFCTVGVAGARDDPASFSAANGNVRLKIESLPLDKALGEFSQQTGLRFYFVADPAWDDFLTPPIRGWYSYSAALDLLLAKSGLHYRFIGPKQIQIGHPTDEVGHRASTAELTAGIDEINWPGNWQRDRPSGIPEVLIHGSRGMNADMARSARGTQPYTIISRDEAERDQTDSVQGLIGRRVPASLSADRGTQSGVARAGTSQISFHGLGVRETLVLINGRRASAPFVGGAPAQADLTAIPVSDIERIEILPTTASGVYGGGATAGVVNVVLRSDCKDTRIMVGYANAFESDSGARRAFLHHCFKFGADESTTLRLSGSYSKESELSTEDRHFLQRRRVQLLTDTTRASPCNGPPPLGAQTNIRTADGSGLDGPGSPCFTSIPAGYDADDGEALLLANAGHYNLQLADSAQLNGGSHSVLRNGPATRYANATFNHEFSRDASVYVDAMASQSIARNSVSIAEPLGFEGAFISADAPNNPLHRALVVTAPAIGGDGTLMNRLGSHVVTAGLAFSLSPTSKFGVEYTRSAWTLRFDQPTASPATDDIASGRLDLLRDFTLEPLGLQTLERGLFYSPLTSRSDVLTMRWARSLFDLPAGAVWAAAFVEHRSEHFRGGTEFVRRGAEEPVPTSYLTRQARSVDSAYLETLIPLLPAAETSDDTSADSRAEQEPPRNGIEAVLGVGGLGAGRGMSRLELQLAVRADYYSANAAAPRQPVGTENDVVRAKTSFTSVNPTIGLRYRPVPDVTLRTSFATGFLPPSGDEIAPSASRVFLPGQLRDRRRDNEPTGAVEFTAGGNPDLNPERSRSWSAGVLWTPSSVPELQLSLDYLSILKKDDIVNPADLFFSDPVRFETLYSGRVTRGPMGSGEPFAVGPITAVNATAINISQAKIEAVDALLAYEAPGLRIGDLRLSLRTSWQPTLRVRASPSSPGHNEAGIGGNALRYGGVAELALKRGDWDFYWDASFYGPYESGGIGEAMRSEVHSQTYHDLSVTRRFWDHGENTASMFLQLNVHNVFNHHPPLDPSAPNYYSGFGDPRLATYSVSLTALF